MADDLNLLAGLEGLVSGISSVAVPVLSRRANLKDMYQMEMAKAQAGEQASIRSENRAFQQKKSLIPLEEESAIRKEQAKPRTTFVQMPDGSIIPYEGKFSRAPLSPAERKAQERKEKMKASFPKAQGSYNNAIQSYDTMIREAEKILNDKALSSATGLFGQYNKITPGARRISANLETIKSKTLLNVLGALKELSATGASGFGALNQSEGDALKNSIANLSRSLGTKDFKDNARTFIGDVTRSKNNVKNVFHSTYEDIIAEDLGAEEE